MKTVEVKPIKCEADVQLIPVETIQYGLTGQQSYEGVEPVDNN